MRFRLSLRRRRWALVALFVLALFLLLARSPDVVREVFRPEPAPEGWHRVTRVFDADTIEVEPNPSPSLAEGSHIRLIGVDAPEMGHSPRARQPGQPDPFAVEGTVFVRQLVEGRRVRLEFGPERGDRYGRTLAYVYLEDGTLLNAELIRRGYARAYRRFAHPLREEFILLEEEARAARRGLWTQP
ncbi:MAG: thermonuclease family protein [Candidatus Acidoferrales bacterium]